jgi:hypothetical protein
MTFSFSVQISRQDNHLTPEPSVSSRNTTIDLPEIGSKPQSSDTDLNFPKVISNLVFFLIPNKKLSPESKPAG